MLVYLGLAVFLVFSLIFAINVGAVSINPRIIFSIIVNHITGREVFEVTWGSAQEAIVWTLRLPRVLVAACVGAGLSLAGVFMQALTKNPLADPYILGISSGASTGAVVSLLIGTLPVIGRISLPAGAFIGALFTAFLVFVLGGRGINGSMTRLVLLGTAISALFSALTNLIIFLTPDTRAVTSAMFWMTGSFSGIDWGDVPLAAITLAIGIVIAMAIHRELDALLIGETLAKNYGVNTLFIRILLILASTLLTAVMVSMSGIIGFVGLVIPHISRGIMGAAHKRMIWVALLLGSSFMVWADVVARVCVAPEELPVGVVTALIGVPFFLVMLYRSRYDFSK